MSEVEVDEMLCLCALLDNLSKTMQSEHTMSNKASKVTSYYAMPCRAFPVVKLVLISSCSFPCLIVLYLFLNVLCNVLIVVRLVIQTVGR